MAAQHPLKEFKETDLLVGRVSPLRAAVRQFVVERLGLKTLVWERTGDSARCGQRDVATFTGTQLTLGVIGMIATLVPALRVNPVVALRNE